MSGEKLNVEFVRAGAGSGKTYHLTNLLAGRLEDGSARATGVIATTFTVKAATELRERARATLLKKGRIDLAAGVGQARIGTINSVCGQLIQRFCFELGVSPDQQVLDEQETSRIAKVALESVQMPDELEQLLEVSQRLGIGQGNFNRMGADQRAEKSIAETIRLLMNAARENNLAPEQLAGMGAVNADEMLKAWPAAAVGVSKALAVEIDAALPALEKVRAGGNVTGVLAKAIDKLLDVQQQLATNSLPWSTWHSLLKLDPGAKQRPILERLKELANQHGSDEQFHKDVRVYLDLIFHIASRGLEAFDAIKREMGVVDFTDQEVRLLQGLKESDVVQQALREELDLVLVDEFQDTNPLQLAIFIELAKLAKSSVWVGDQKQAIYGFRGTDSTLIQQVLGSVEAWGGKLGAPLSDSWRSTPALVKVVNETFVPAFAPSPAADIALSAKREAIADHADVLNWSFETPPGKRNLHVQALGPALSQLLGSGALVFDKDTKVLRPLKAGDIAVLCRYKSVIKEVVGALSRWGIPVAAERPGLMATAEVQLVVACLRRLHDRDDSVASAAIVGLTQALEPEQWLHDRLQFMANTNVDEQGRSVPSQGTWKVKGEGAQPLLGRLDALRTRLISLTPFEVLRMAKAESGVVQHCYAWAANERSAQVRIANVEALLGLGRRYEEECLSSGHPATLNGLLLWLQKLEGDEQDGRAAASLGAVEVMTFHAAKGLEWPVVVVMGLDHEHRTDLWSVRARTVGAFDASAPLANRFIHYWPYPYGAADAANVPNAVSAQETVLGRAMDEAARQENIRLLYVTLTRARDQLALVSKSADPAPLQWLAEAEGADKLWTPTGKRVIDGVSVSFQRSDWSVEGAAAEPPAKVKAALQFYPRRASQDFAPLWVTPSAVHAEGYGVAEVVGVGARIEVRPGADLSSVGSALHNCIAYAVADPDKGISVSDVREILERWGVAAAVDAQQALSQINAFAAWHREKWPEAVVRAEVPFEAKRADGAIARGQVDLLLSLPEQHILFDHKADPRGAGEANRLASAHGGQLAEYAQAIQAASGKPVTERWLFLPVAAQAVRIVGGM